MKISVVIPVLNEIELLPDQLQLLQSFRRLGHEVIVVDAGSNDGSAEIAVSLADRICIASRGRAHQMNVGAGVATGDVLLFLHVDTRLPKNFDCLIASGLNAANRHWGRFDVQLSSRERVFSVIAFAMNLRSYVTGVATGDQAIFVRSDFFLRHGGFAEIPLMEDVELSKRLRRNSRPVRIKQRVITSARRWQQKGILRTVVIMWKLRFYYFFGVNPERLARIYNK